MVYHELLENYLRVAGSNYRHMMKQKKLKATDTGIDKMPERLLIL